MDTDGHGFNYGVSLRKVLDCGSPLPLFPSGASKTKRQRAGAVQDAGAILAAPKVFLSVLIRVHPWLNRKNL